MSDITTSDYPVTYDIIVRRYARPYDDRIDDLIIETSERTGLSTAAIVRMLQKYGITSEMLNALTSSVYHLDIFLDYGIEYKDFLVKFMDRVYYNNDEESAGYWASHYRLFLHSRGFFSVVL